MHIYKDKMEKHLSFIKIGDGKHRYEDLPYEHLPIPDNLSGIKTYTNTGTGSISFTDFHDNIFVYQLRKSSRDFSPAQANTKSTQGFLPI